MTDRPTDRHGQGGSWESYFSNNNTNNVVILFNETYYLDAQSYIKRNMSTFQEPGEEANTVKD